MNLKSCCRLCLSEPKKEVFESILSNSNALQFLSLLTDIKIDPDGPLSISMCNNCSFTISQIYLFKNKIEEASVTQRDILQSAMNKQTDKGYQAEFVFIHEEGAKKDHVVVKVKNQVDDSVAVPKKKVSYECSMCNRKFPSSLKLKRHREKNPECSLIDTSTEPHDFRCDHCTDTFANEHDQKLHAILHDPSSHFRCPTCGRSCVTYKSFKRHIRTHFISKLKCKTCDMEFSETGSLTRHYKRHLGIKKAKTLVCFQCGKSFSDQKSYNGHLNMHKGLKNFVCETCGKSFQELRFLRSHSKIHLDVKEYKCDFCNFESKHQSALSKHIKRKHTEKSEDTDSDEVFEDELEGFEELRQEVDTGLVVQEKLPCKVCNQYFTPAYLDRHILLHMNEKRFVCTEDDCDKTFPNVGQLNYHVKVKHAPNPLFACQLCGKVCASKISLDKHWKAHQKRDGQQIV